MLQNLTSLPPDSFHSKLHEWFDVNHRNLPWRETKDPYLIWLSEIILQQTRVAQGTSYYLRFASRWPTLKSLAHAEEQDVLKEWQGLGYYSRARNLLAAAKNMYAEFGHFPHSYEEIRQQKGIGSYTAAAIASFAYNLPYAVLDGNVFRFIARLFGVDTPIDTSAGKKVFSLFADSLLDKKQPGLHNQAMMEFGAIQCIQNNPECSGCPFSDYCVAYAQQSIDTLPVKSKKTTSKSRYFNYLFLLQKSDNMEFTLLQKRTQKDIWQHLYELPMFEADHCFSDSELFQSSFLQSFFPEMIESTLFLPPFSARHILSHQVIHARFFPIRTSILLPPPSCIKIPLSEIDSFPVSRLTEIFLGSFFAHIQNSK